MRKIVGITVGTALSPEKIKEKINPVLSVNGVEPDESGNVKQVFDYEQNDKTAPDYIKNRPFYSERTVLFDGKGKEYEFDNVSIDFDLEVGKTYAITMNGTEYSSVCELSEYKGNEAKKLAFSVYSIYCTNGKLYANFDEHSEGLKIDLKIELENIKKIDEKYLPEGWNSNEDETTPDWVATKKPMGGEEVYISQQTLSSGMWSKLQMNFQVGLTYDVYFNGEVYPCVAYNEDGGVYLGNVTLMDSSSKNEHNNEPFCIYWAGAGATSGFFYKSSAVSYPVTLKVTDHIYVEYNKMPKEYLPDVSDLDANWLEELKVALGIEGR